ncbi:MAG: hypothetical protein HY738_14890, partial [Bacteroidia bacterium]|nr:hypothetical protein [Bacteroidia bacterium]
ALAVNAAGGVANTAVGYAAGDAITTGDGNTALGFDALGATTTAVGQTAVGYRALVAATVGANTAIGWSAGNAITSGGNNVAIGYNAVGTNTDVSGLVGIGYNALAVNASGGLANTAVGYSAGAAITTGDNNTILGYGAADALTTGISNIAIGYDAFGGAATAADGNAIIGYQAGDAITTGDYNVALGYNAVGANTDVTGLVGIGYNALAVNASGGLANTAVGYSAGAAITTGDNNTLLGYTAGDALTTSTGNTALGYDALGTATTGISNTAIGCEALRNLAAGAYDNNTGVGYHAMFNSGQNLSNTAVGSQAMNGTAAYNNSINNTAIGFNSLTSIQDNSNNNTTVGTRSLQVVTTGDNNIALGYQAGDNITTGSTNIIIGYDVDAPAAATSNQLSIGNLIFATGGFGTGTTLGTGNVAIGMNAPAGKLHVANQLRLGIPLGGLGGAAAGVGSMVFYNSTNANTMTVQSGVSTGNYTLTLPVDDGTAGQQLQTDGAGALTWSAAGGAANTYWETDGNTGQADATNNLGSTDAVDIDFITTNIERMTILSGGDVGINMAPTMRLDVTDASVVAGEATIRGSATGAAQTYGVLGTTTSSTGRGVFGNGNSGTGVYGTSSSTGAPGGFFTNTGDYYGLVATVSNSTYMGAYADNTDPLGTGIVGVGNNIVGSYLTGGSGGAFSSTNVGVYGYGDATAASWGVYGSSDAADGIGVSGDVPLGGINAFGVKGSATTGTGVGGFATGAGGWGVWGDVTGVANGKGVYGYSDDATGDGVYGINTSAGGGVVGYGNDISGTGVVGIGDNSTTRYTLVNGSGAAFTGQDIGLYVQRDATADANGEGCIYTSYRTDVTTRECSYNYRSGGNMYKALGDAGYLVSTQVFDLNNNKVIMFCPEAPEPLFQDYGTGQLVDGKAYIKLDPIFSKNIMVNDKHPLRVFVQLKGDCNGVYVTNDTAEGFEVIELQGGKSNVQFYYTVTANIKDIVDENTREMMSNFDVRFPLGPQALAKKAKEMENSLLLKRNVSGEKNNSQIKKK